MKFSVLQKSIIFPCVFPTKIICIWHHFRNHNRSSRNCTSFTCSLYNCTGQLGSRYSNNCGQPEYCRFSVSVHNFFSFHPFTTNFINTDIISYKCKIYIFYYYNTCNFFVKNKSLILEFDTLIFEI